MRLPTRLAAAVAVVAITSLGIPSVTADTPSTPPSALGVVPYIDSDPNSNGGNVDCTTVNPLYVETSDRVNYNEVSGGFDAPFPSGVVVTTDGTLVSFTSLSPIAAVIVKGSNDANVYDYVRDGRFVPVLSDSGLASPLNASGGSAGLSNLTFCSTVPFGGPVESLAVTKTATTSYTRTHSWDIDKSVSTAQLDLYAPGGGGATTGTIEWTIDVDHEGSVDSDHELTGTVTIVNDGTADATITSIDDVFGPADLVIPVDCGVVTLPVTLAPDDELECTYAQSLDSAVAGTNTVTVTTSTAAAYTATAAATWGEPATEIDKQVTVSDSRYSWPAGAPTVVAPSDASFSYSESFDWVDFECVQTTIDNTASLSNGQSDSASTIVRGQCRRFNGETAWGAGTRYNRTGGNWATSTAYTGTTKTVTLFAGRTNVAGSVTLAPSATPGRVDITVALVQPWLFADGAENLKVQGYSTAPTGNPSPGLFANKASCPIGASTCTISVPAAAFYGIHLDVGYWVYSWPTTS